MNLDQFSSKKDCIFFLCNIQIFIIIYKKMLQHNSYKYKKNPKTLIFVTKQFIRINYLVESNA